MDDPAESPTPQQKQDMLLQHVILPRLLPQQKSRHLHQIELQLMQNMTENILKLREKIPSETVELFANFWKIHDEAIPKQSAVMARIKALRSGKSFAMFVRRQNCMFVIHAPRTKNAEVPEEVIIATFPGNLHPDEVYHYDSDIEVNENRQNSKSIFRNCVQIIFFFFF